MSDVRWTPIAARARLSLGQHRTSGASYPYAPIDTKQAWAAVEGGMPKMTSYHTPDTVTALVQPVRVPPAPKPISAYQRRLDKVPRNRRNAR
jgi:hypothetical protein